MLATGLFPGRGALGISIPLGKPEADFQVTAVLAQRKHDNVWRRVVRIVRVVRVVRIAGIVHWEAGRMWF